MPTSHWIRQLRSETLPLNGVSCSKPGTDDAKLLQLRDGLGGSGCVLLGLRHSRWIGSLSGWQKGMQPIPQSPPSESIPTKQPPQNSGPTYVPNAVARQNQEPLPKATGQFVGNVYNRSANLSARFRISVRDDAGKLSGCMRVDRPLFGSGPIDGRVLGDELTFSVSSWVGTIKFVGHESNDFVKGSYTVEHRNGQSGEMGSFTLQKVDSQGPEGDFNPAHCPTD